MMRAFRGLVEVVERGGDGRRRPDLPGFVRDILRVFLRDMLMVFTRGAHLLEPSWFFFDVIAVEECGKEMGKHVEYYLM